MRHFALLLVCALALSAQERRFQAIEIFVDSGEALLAAWQIELTIDDATIVGVEGGEPEAWREPPHYDPEALMGGRIILAAFTTGEAPAGRVRVARLHVEASGDAAERAVIAAVVAATTDGERIPIEVECIPFGEKR